MSEQKTKALKLLKFNPFLSPKEKAGWEDLIETMTERHLNKFIDVFEKSRVAFRELLMKKFEDDPNGEWVEKFNTYKKNVFKKTVKAVQKKESKVAEDELEDSLKNL